jgi:RNA polymerase sigma-70 factor, ECF subfamily
MSYIKMDPETERELVESAKTDPDAFSLLYRNYFPQIFNYVARRLGDVGAAQEVTSDTFFEAMHDIRTFQWRGLPFSSWLYRIATNNINSYLRKKSNSLLSLDFLFAHPEFEIARNVDIEQEIIHAEEELQRYQDYLFIQKQILQLPIPYQEVLTLRYFENKKINEIGEILNKKENTIKSLLLRGLEKLRKSYKSAKANPAKIASMQPFSVKDALYAEDPNYEK